MTTTGYCDDSSGALVLLGLGLFVSGVVLTPVGWTMFAASYGPGAHFHETPPAGHVTAAFAVMPLRGGAGVGGSLVF